MKMTKPCSTYLDENKLITEEICYCLKIINEEGVLTKDTSGCQKW